MGPAAAAPLSAENLRFILGLKLRRLRQQRGLSLKELARGAGLSISYLSEIEKGKKYPKPEKLLGLAGALEVPFDELVSPRVSEELDPLRAAMSSGLLKEFPFELFGVEPEEVFSLLAEDPVRLGALLRTFLEVGRLYDVQVEQFLLAALRAYQQLHGNYFEELEEAARRYREERDWPGGRRLTAAALAAELTENWSYTIDETTLPDHPALATLRSVYVDGRPPRLLVNGRLLPVQKAFVLAREIGYRHLRLGERALTSSWLEVSSFEQVLNNFKASYFGGALLLDAERLGADLESFFARRRWSAAALVDLMERHGATPEMFFHRLTELLPRRFGLEAIFFMRFTAGTEGKVRMTKFLNESPLPLPHGIGLSEHYCRRWPAVRMLDTMSAARRGEPGAPAVTPQRSFFLDDGAEFLVLSAARPLALASNGHSAVSLGLEIGADFAERVAFVDDPKIPRVDVNLTCERCRLSPEECSDRAAEPRVVERQAAQARKKAAVAELLERFGAGGS